jgi:E3 ubiquitin-protein ligase MARCH6
MTIWPLLNSSYLIELLKHDRNVILIYESPIFCDTLLICQLILFFQNWALGVLHAKIICAVTMMGPQWWLKRATEEVYNNGLRNLNLTFIMTHLCIPIIGSLGMALAVPYVIGKSIVPALGESAI